MMSDCVVTRHFCVARLGKTFRLVFRSQRPKLEEWDSPITGAEVQKVVIGNAVLYQGDCLEAMDSINRVDAVITDPPYSTPTVACFGREVVKRLSDLAIQEFYFGEIKKQIEKILPESGPLLAFCDDSYFPVLFGLFYSWKQTNLLVWDKGRIGMGNPFRRQHELIFYANRGSIKLQEETSYLPTIFKETPTKIHHGAEKPVALLSRLITGLVPKGATVFDPFMGSGSTGVAALSSGRKFIGVDLDPGYFEIACRRIEAAQMEIAPIQEVPSLVPGSIPRVLDQEATEAQPLFPE
jgi:DNA modification methylase